MAWRIGEQVEKGEIDNRVKGRVSGRIWLAGLAQPLRLELSGNCLRDLAGCHIRFENPSPKPEDGSATPLAALQCGRVGDMTASRKVRVLDVGPEEAMRLAQAGMPIPEHLGNSLYLEWFGGPNGRIVIENAGLRIAISEPEWTLSEDEERKQAVANQEALLQYLQELGIPGDREDGPGD